MKKKQPMFEWVVPYFIVGISLIVFIIIVLLFKKC